MHVKRSVLNMVTFTEKNVQVLGKVIWKGYISITSVHVRERGTENALTFLCGFIFGDKFAEWYRNMIK